MIRPLHTWLSLILGLLVAVVAVTGAASVYRVELDHWAAGVVPGDAAPSALRAPALVVIRERFPTARIGGLECQPGLDAWTLREGEAAWTVFTDPATGAWRGTTHDNSLATVVRATAQFHHDLWLKPVGEWLVGLAGVVLLVLTITGALLWWPGLGRLGQVWTWRWSHPRLRWYDLHRHLGLAGVLLLPLVTVTGLLYAFPSWRPVVHRALGGTAEDRPLALRPPAERPKAIGTGPALGWDEVLVVARATVPEATPLRVLPPRPKDATAPWTVLMDHPGNRSSKGGIAVAIDPRGGGVLAVLDPRGASPGGWILNQLWALHTGTWAGRSSQILTALAGLLVPTLLISGVLLWWRRTHP
jgi:uncharacterized iron-regulated membrane protein